MDDRIQSGSYSKALRYLGAAFLGGLGLWLVRATVNLSLHKHFSIDEFEYAHGAWLIAQGEVVVIDEHFGFRVTEIVDARKRLESLKNT